MVVGAVLDVTRRGREQRLVQGSVMSSPQDGEVIVLGLRGTTSLGGCLPMACCGVAGASLARPRPASGGQLLAMRRGVKAAT